MVVGRNLQYLGLRIDVAVEHRRHWLLEVAAVQRLGWAHLVSDQLVSFQNRKLFGHWLEEQGFNQKCCLVGLRVSFGQIQKDSTVSLL